MQFDTGNSVLQELEGDLLTRHKVKLFVKRDDLIHPYVSGNKWRKLKYNFAQFKISRKERVLTFGGAFSNHLLATASACSQLNIPSIGIVRGDELNAGSNPLLKKCSELGMQLEFVTRSDYSLRYERPYLEELAAKFQNSFIVPEGGANYYGIIGCQELVHELKVQPDHIFVAQGTTTTSCGIGLGMKKGKLHVVPVLKGFDAINEMRFILKNAKVDEFVIDEILNRTKMHDSFHFGGYGKWNEELLQLIQEVEKAFNIPLDKTYTGKAFTALLHEIKSGGLDHTTVVFIHTGGVHRLN